MSDDKNLNNCFYKDLDTNFEKACELAGKDFSHEELVNMLKNGTIPEKQISALKFDFVSSENDAKLLIDNLTGCDGKIREAVASKIYQLLVADKCSAKFFIPYSDVFADASIDINGNICRLIADSVVFLKSYDAFSKSYAKKLIEFALQALQELDKFIFRDKKYVINKQLFKLYWCLEGLSNFYEFEDINTIKQILEKCSNISEYTIREKTAKISVISPEFAEIKEKLKNDTNYYVRQICL